MRSGFLVAGYGLLGLAVLLRAPAAEVCSGPPSTATGDMAGLARAADGLLVLGSLGASFVAAVAAVLLLVAARRPRA